MNHTQHRLIHPERDKDGIVTLDALIRTVTANERYMIPLTPKEIEKIKTKQQFIDHLETKHSDKIEAHREQVIEELTKGFAYAINMSLGLDRKQINPVTGAPYPEAEHYISVGSILANIGCGVDGVVAGFIHDLERNKQGLKLDDLKEHFNAKVVTIVDACTDYAELKGKKGDTDASRSKRKNRSQQNHLRKALARPEAILVRGADRLHNFLSFGLYSIHKQREKLKETIEYYLPLLQVTDSRLYFHLNEIVEEHTKKPLLKTRFDGIGSLYIAFEILKNYSITRACTYSVFCSMADFVQTWADESQKEFLTEHVNGAFDSAFNLMTGDRYLDLPNLPTSNAMGEEAQGKIKRAQQRRPHSIISGDDSICRRTMWNDIASDLYFRLATSTDRRNCIEAYFLECANPHVDEKGKPLKPTFLTHSQLQALAMHQDITPKYFGAYKTNQGERIDHIVIESTLLIDRVLKQLTGALHVGEPMYIHDITFSDRGNKRPILDNKGYTVSKIECNGEKGIRIYYDWSNLPERLRAEGIRKQKAGLENVDGLVKVTARSIIPSNPYLVVDVVMPQKHII